MLIENVRSDQSCILFESYSRRAAWPAEYALVLTIAASSAANGTSGCSPAWASACRAGMR